MDIPIPTQQVLIVNGINSIAILLKLDDSDLGLLQTNNEEVLMGHTKSIKMFKRWCLQTSLKKKLIDVEWMEEFFSEIWDDFLLNEASTVTRSTKKTVPSMVSVSEEPKAVSKDDINVKVHIRSYPTFSGKNNDWKSYKRKFEALASIHGFSFIMKKDFIVPDKGDDDAYHIYDKRSSFLQSILEYSLASGTALSRVTRFSSSGDGRNTWLSLRTWFEGQGRSQEAIAKKAPETITSHKLTENSNGGTEAFMEKFEGALQELDEIGRSYDIGMAKINFLTMF